MSIRFAVLTQENNDFGKRVLHRLAELELFPACIGVERMTWRKRWRSARFLARKTGFANAAYYSARTWPRLIARQCLGRLEEFDYGIYSEDWRVDVNVNSRSMRKFLSDHDLDLLVLAGPGIVRKQILELPRIGALNCHAGRLPRFRGVDVTRWALSLGERPAVTLHFVDAGVDTGDIVEICDIPVGESDTINDVKTRTGDRAVELLSRAVQRVADGGTLPRVPQQKSDGRQYYLMPRRDGKRLEREWPDLRRKLAP
jgi:folate-dependent phosphoribosylglycinamide formyltransferase PurN